jgi:hypothetical protein
MRYGINKKEKKASFEISIDLLSKVNRMLKYGDVINLSATLRQELIDFQLAITKSLDEYLYGPSKTDVELYKAQYIKDAKALKIKYLPANSSPEELDSIISQNLCSKCSNDPGACAGHIGRNGRCHLFIDKSIDMS